MWLALLLQHTAGTPHNLLKFIPGPAASLTSSPTPTPTFIPALTSSLSLIPAPAPAHAPVLPPTPAPTLSRSC